MSLSAWTTATTLVSIVSLANMASAVAGPPVMLHNAHVDLISLPAGGLQPRAAVDRQGRLHIVYFRGEPAHGDLYYVCAPVKQPSAFSLPIRVNSVSGSACALGTIRGAQIAVSHSGQVFVVWNGSDRATSNGAPQFVFSQLSADRKAFAPERNILPAGQIIDGGGAVAVGERNKVYVFWHAVGFREPESKGRVYMTKSSDGGKTYSAATAIDKAGQGTCGCCSMAALVEKGNIYVLYRRALANTARDTTFLQSHDGGTTFRSTNLQPWRARTCPMSLFALSAASAGLPILGAWETRGVVTIGGDMSIMRGSGKHLFEQFETESGIDMACLENALAAMSKPASIPASDPKDAEQKYPSIAENEDGSALLCWIEGAGWERGGRLRWRLLDKKLQPVAYDAFNNHSGTKTAVTQASPAPNFKVPSWSFAAAVALRKGEYGIIY